MESLKQLVEDLGKLKSISGKNDKQAFLKSKEDDVLFREVLKFLLNDFITTGISKKKISRKPKVDDYVRLHNIKEALDYLSEHNSGRDKDVFSMKYYVVNYALDYKDILEQIFTKSLKLGVSADTYNKVFPNDKIPVFKVMLAKSYCDNMNKVKGDFAITTKLDGNRILIVKDNDGDVKAFTRTGKEYEGLDLMLGQIRNLPLNGLVLDGELIAESSGTIAEQFAETQSMARGKSCNKEALRFHAFDIISYDEFQGKYKSHGALQRKRELSRVFEKFGIILPSFVHVKPLYIGDDISKIEELMESHVEPNGLEGLMINLDIPYQLKRTHGLLKVKKFRYCDIPIIGFEEGEGKLKGTLGRLNVLYKGSKVGVGTGLTDEDRAFFWNNQDKMLNRIVEIKYFEESKNKKDDSISLRFPVFVRIREEDKEISYD